jgi:hypothetical protein
MKTNFFEVGEIDFSKKTNYFQLKKLLLYVYKNYTIFCIKDAKRNQNNIFHSIIS